MQVFSRDKIKFSASLHTPQQGWQRAAGHWEHPGTTCWARQVSQHSLECKALLPQPQLCLSSHSGRKRLPNKHNTWEEKLTESPPPSQPPSANCCKPTAPCLLAPVTQPGSGKCHQGFLRDTAQTVHCLAICCPFAGLCP